MKKLSQAKFESENKNIQVLCDADITLGELHDFLIEVKSDVVESMLTLHKKDVEKIEKSKTEEKSEEKKD